MGLRASPRPRSHRPADAGRIHEQAALRLASADQRYTAGRRALVEVLGGTARPLTTPEILSRAAGGVPQSSAYRNLTVLVEAGVVRRLAGADDVGRFELSEELTGDHHHHVVCADCGTVVDVTTSTMLERALSEAGRVVASQTGFTVTDHRIDLVGRCPDCTGARPDDPLLSSVGSS
ncbi:MAG: Fur family transcriptional regulator [Acidimicrobiales bacterium]